jgi:exopolysaccharide biosynthesis polyprenyl glycosylphosphotransferase
MSMIYGFVPEAPLGGNPFVAGLVVLVGFLLGLRFCHGVRRRRPVVERVLILGGSALGRQVIEEIARRPYLRYAVVGLAENAENLGRVIEATRPHRIVVALAERRGRLPLYPLLESRARGILVEDAAETYARLTGKLALEVLSPSSVIFSPDFHTSRLQLGLSRALSLLASVVGLIVLAPVLSLIVLVIKLDSRGPLFFVQERVGLGGRSFKLIKFRTMHPVSRPKSEWEQDNWDRITRVGKWLRRFRLDELPQLVNVLRGDMNLVGPRPHPESNLELMILAVRNLSEVSGDAIPYYSLRCSVRPGITGWAQIRYGYANTLEEEMEKVRYDFYYLKHMSFWLDLRILFETVKIVFSGDGSDAAGAGRLRGRERRPGTHLGRAA